MKQHGFAAVVFASVLAISARAVASPGDLTMVDVSGVRHAVSDFRGKWLLVNYWATWCAACIEEMPALSALTSQEPELSIIGVTDEKLAPDQLREFVTKHPIDYPLGWSKKAAIPHELSPSIFGVEVRPISYLIAPDGSVAKRYLGTIDVAKLRLLLASHPAVAAT